MESVSKALEPGSRDPGFDSHGAGCVQKPCVSFDSTLALTTQQEWVPGGMKIGIV